MKFPCENCHRQRTEYCEDYDNCMAWRTWFGENWRDNQNS